MKWIKTCAYKTLETAPWSLFSKLALFVFLSTNAIAQQTQIYQDGYQRYLQARQWFAEEKYALAQPVFLQIENELSQVSSGKPLFAEELRFYNLACGLINNSEQAVAEANQYLADNNSLIFKEQLAFYLGNYYFNKSQFAEALTAYEKSGFTHLNNDQVATLQFRQGYALFTQKKFNEARPLLDAVRQSPDLPYYVDANYYYGLIAFQERRYNEALKCFEIARSSGKYEALVPYYTAGINYATGNKEKAMQQAEQALRNGNTYYKTELMQLLGHGYFEKKDYAKAKTYLEQYVNASSKVKREDLYELAYCYYVEKQYSKAIEKFKPLSSGEDSLSQHAMYLLGDAYLKTNDKPNARNAFLFCSSNKSGAGFREVGLFNYGKLSFELGYDNEALLALKEYTATYPSGKYAAEARDLLVGVLAKTSNYKEALELYETLPNKSDYARQLYPQIAFNRAQELINDRNIQAGEALLDKVIAAPSNQQVLPLAYFWKGEIAYAKGAYDQSVVQFTRYLEKPVNAAETNEVNGRYNLGYSLLRVGEYRQAAQQFEKIVDQRFTNPSQSIDVMLRLADCYYMQKDFNRAASLYNRVVAQRNYGADYALLQTGMISGAQQKPGEKITTLRSIETLYPASPLVAVSHMEIADTYLSDEKFKDALPYLNKVVANKNASSMKPQAYLKTGLAHYNLDNNSEALQAFKTLVKQYPQAEESEEAIDNIRSIYVEQGNPDAYVSFLKEAGRKVDNNVADSLSFTAAELKYSEGRKQEAQTGFANYLKQYPNGRYMLEANYYLAEISRENKKLKEAVVYYDAVARLAPNKYAERSLLQLSRYYYFEEKNYTSAAVYYQQLKQYAQSAENRLEAMRGLVRCQYHAGEFDKATDNARELLQQGGAGSDDKIFANLVLGKQAQKSGNCNEAINYFKNVTGLSKADYGAEARYEIATCLLQLSKLEEAEKAAFEVINKSGSYEWWVTKSYILLGDIYLAQKDYFNAKATYKSVADNAGIAELKNEGAAKLVKAEEAEAAQSKLGGMK